MIGAILNDTSVRRGTSAQDMVELHLGSVRLERIQRLTREVDGRVGNEIDELDRVAMRLLLEEYVAAVAHLRAVLRDGAQAVEDAPAALKTVRRYIGQRQRHQKAPVATAPSDLQPASQIRDK